MPLDARARDATDRSSPPAGCEAPGNVTELAGGGLPRGFRAAGVACGIKPSGRPDVGLLVSSAPATTSAARFTRSGALSAPVLLCRERVELAAIRAVVVNSGNANAATGRPRASTTRPRCRAAAALAAASPGGRGGGRLDRRDRRAAADGHGHARDRRAPPHELRPDGDVDFAEAIRTTDAFEKRAPLDVALAGGHRPSDRPGQGRRDDLAGLRDAARASSRPTPRCRRRPATCCSACASSARSSGSASTASCRPPTP